MKRIKENMTFLKALVDLSENGQSKELLKKVTKGQVTAIAEIASNVLAKVLSVSRRDKIALQPHRRVIRRLGEKGISFSTRQALVARNPKAIRLLVKAVFKKLVALVQ